MRVYSPGLFWGLRQVEYAGANERSERLLTGWIYAGSAMLGGVCGLALSVLTLGFLALETPEYVQRRALPVVGEDMQPIDAQLLIEELADEQQLAGVETGQLLDGSEETSRSDNALSDTEAPEMGPALVLADGQQVIGVDFDLGNAADRSNDLEIIKTIRLNGQSIGSASLAIDAQSRLHVSSQDLSNLLPEDLFARVDRGTSYIEFDDLRADGLDISYDPVSDTIEIVT